MEKILFTSESVTEGHPDKLCDLISDTILDECLKQDKKSRVAIETFASNNKIVIAGQVTTNAIIDIEAIARKTMREIGYNNEYIDINPENCEISINIIKQSLDIAQGVDIGGAGDQGIMFGYACDETEEYMPFAISMAHKLSKRLTEARKKGILPYLCPDGKTQVTVEYEDDKPVRIDTILISSQHTENVDLNTIRKDLIEKVINEVVPQKYLDEDTKYYINPTGRFVIGGPLGDTGLTGRKIIVDTYGGYAHHGGGAFSVKYATKVDRSAAYMLRFIAKNIVANGYAKKCELQVAYGIGIAEPISIFINTFGTNTIPNEEIITKIKRKFNLTPKGIIEYLGLEEPIFTKTTNYGHFGKKELPWEQIINF